MSLISGIPFSAVLDGSETLRRTTADYFCPCQLWNQGKQKLVFPYAFCGAILSDVDASTSSIVVPVDEPCFEYPRAFQSERNEAELCPAIQRLRDS